MTMSTRGKLRPAPEYASACGWPLAFWRTLAWSALAIPVAAALALQGLAAGARATPQPTDACRAALAAGDHVPEGFLAHVCVEASHPECKSA
jgi:hypothetical protein